MPLHPQAVAFLELLASLGDLPMEHDTPQNVRAVRRARRRPSTEPIHEIRDVDANGVKCRLYRPVDGVIGLLVFIHGGGWVTGDLESHDGICRSLANHSGHAVMAVEYRLSPEARFPAALDDCETAVRWAFANAEALGVDRLRFAVGGDSAGGNMAAVIAQAQPVPLCFQMLIYPATDARCTAPSWTENAAGPFLTAAGMRWFYGHYLGESGENTDGGLGTGAVDRTDPRLSPLLAEPAVLAGSPPAFVLTAEFDPLRDEGEMYAAALAATGVPVVLQRVYGQFHAFFSQKGVLDDTDAAHACAASALRAAFDRAATPPTEP